MVGGERHRRRLCNGTLYGRTPLFFRPFGPSGARPDRSRRSLHYRLCPANLFRNRLELGQFGGAVMRTPRAQGAAMTTMRTAIVLSFCLGSQCLGSQGLSQYQNQVVATNGSAVAGAQITVTRLEAPTPPVPLFADAEGATTPPNPLTSDANGFYSFFVPAGTYHLSVASATYNTTLVGVGIADPRKPHTVTGSDEKSPLTMVASAMPASSGNAVLTTERLNTDGSRRYGPWSLYVNNGATSARAAMHWTYNVSWNELNGGSSGFITADEGFQLRLSMDNPACPNCPMGRLLYAPPGAVGATPQWSTIWSTTALDPITGPTPVVQHGPFVLGDGLDNSSLVARRVNHDLFYKSAPAGALLA